MTGLKKCFTRIISAEINEVRPNNVTAEGRPYANNSFVSNGADTIFLLKTKRSGEKLTIYEITVAATIAIIVPVIENPSKTSITPTTIFIPEIRIFTNTWNPKDNFACRKAILITLISVKNIIASVKYKRKTL